MSNVMNMANECRTIRRYSHDRLPSVEELTALIGCARLAPSAANLQRLRYKLIVGEDAENAFSAVSMGGYFPPEERTVADECPGAYIVLLSEVQSPDTNLAIDIGIAAELIVLRACEMGYGSCMIRNFKPELIMDFIKDKKYTPHLVIALGKPAERAAVADITEDGSIKYYHGADGVNVVPKRLLSELIVE